MRVRVGPLPFSVAPYNLLDPGLRVLHDNTMVVVVLLVKNRTSQKKRLRLTWSKRCTEFRLVMRVKRRYVVL